MPFSKNINLGSIITNGGDCHLGDVYYKSIEYKDLQKTIRRLVKFISLSTQQKEKEELTKELLIEEDKLEKFKLGVLSLAELLQKIEIDSERLKLAKFYFEKGDFKGARNTLNVEDINREQNNLLQYKLSLDNKTYQNNIDLRNNSNQYLVLAELTVLDYNLPRRLEKVKEYLELSLKSDRNKDNLQFYGDFLLVYGQTEKCTPLYQEALEIARNLAKVNPLLHSGNVGVILINLSIVYRHTGEHDNAETSLLEAIEIHKYLSENNSLLVTKDLDSAIYLLSDLYRERRKYAKAIQALELTLKTFKNLEKHNPNRFLTKIGLTLNSIGLVLSELNKYKEADEYFKEALELSEKISSNQPNDFYEYSISTLTNYGNLKIRRQELDIAETYLQLALKFCRKQSMKEHFHRSNLGNILVNLANLKRETKDYRVSEALFKEALGLLRKLSRNGTNIYLFSLSCALNNYGNLLQELNHIKRAKKAFLESLKLRKSLAKDSPEMHLPDVAAVYFNLGNIETLNKAFGSAKSFFKQALVLYEKLSKTIPEAFLPDTASVLISLGAHYLFYEKNKELSYKYCDECMDILINLPDNQYNKYLLDKVIPIIQELGLNIEEYINSKDLTYSNWEFVFA